VPEYRGELTEQERREVLSSAGADYGTYVELVRQAVEENPNSRQFKFGLTADEVKERRTHKRRFKAAADMAGYTLEWLPDPQRNIAPDELWARIYKRGEEPVKRQRKKAAAA
jgi:hypothetical protein